MPNTKKKLKGELTSLTLPPQGTMTLEAWKRQEVERRTMSFLGLHGGRPPESLP